MNSLDIQIFSLFLNGDPSMGSYFVLCNSNETVQFVHVLSFRHLWLQVSLKSSRKVVMSYVPMFETCLWVKVNVLSSSFVVIVILTISSTPSKKLTESSRCSIPFVIFRTHQNSLFVVFGHFQKKWEQSPFIPHCLLLLHLLVFTFSLAVCFVHWCSTNIWDSRGDSI